MWNECPVSFLNLAGERGVGGNIPGSKESKYVTVQEKLQHENPAVRDIISRVQNPKSPVSTSSVFKFSACNSAPFKGECSTFCLIKVIFH